MAENFSYKEEACRVLLFLKIQFNTNFDGKLRMRARNSHLLHNVENKALN